jgi:hypothetical protein
MMRFWLCLRGLGSYPLPVDQKTHSVGRGACVKGRIKDDDSDKSRRRGGKKRGQGG